MQIGVESSRAVENKRVFVVEPEEVTRAALQCMLHDEYEAHEVRNLDAAAQKGREHRPDLILLGLAVLQERGTAAMAELKRLFPAVGIVVVAESDGATAVENLLRAGADDVLHKPFRLEAVREMMDRHLGRTRKGCVA